MSVSEAGKASLLVVGAIQLLEQAGRLLYDSGVLVSGRKKGRAGEARPVNRVAAGSVSERGGEGFVAGCRRHTAA